MNPMKEFINNHDQHVYDTFDEFKTKHSKEYDDETEHTRRLNLYRQNMRFIHSKNRQGRFGSQSFNFNVNNVVSGLSYSLASNHLADRSDAEMSVLRGRIYDSSLQYNGGQEQLVTRQMVREAPDTLDWR